MKFIKVADFYEDRTALLSISNIVSISEEFVTGPRTEFMGTLIKMINGDEYTTCLSVDEIQKMIEG